MRIQQLLKALALAICIGVLAYVAITMSEDRNPLNYQDHLEDTAFSVDGQAVTFQDLAFYILFEERKVEEQARIYNPDYTKDYWNIHTNDTFIQLEAKDVVYGMAVHDELFYQLAVAEGMDTLSASEEEELEFAKTDFWEDLLDIQWEKLPCSQDKINDQILKAAIAEKYGNYLASEYGPSQAAYKYDGYYYSQILEDHTVETNKKLWDRFIMGDIALQHGKINYINGLTDADKKAEEK